MQGKPGLESSLFLSFWLRWVLVVLCRLSLVALLGGFSCEARALEHAGSVVVCELPWWLRW